jgi:AraC-like DNA-binding protein
MSRELHAVIRERSFGEHAMISTVDECTDPERELSALPDMGIFETFATDGVEPGRRLEFWNEIACNTFTPVVSDPVDLPTFSASLTRTQIGALRISEVRSEPATIRHTLSQVARSQASSYFLVLQLEGTSYNRQSDREAKLAPGDFTLCASTQPYEMHLPVSARRLVLGVAEGLLRRHLASPDSILGIRMSGNRGMSGLLSDFIKSLWLCRQESWDPTVTSRMAYTVLDLIAATYSVTPHVKFEHASLATAHRARIVSYIESHLRDSDLDPTRIAHACRITPRYLHHLFVQEAETVTQYIQRRRLEECARALIAAPVRGRLVTEIAFDYGFNSLTHFGRVFRNHFGITPSEYRRAAQN